MPSLASGTAYLLILFLNLEMKPALIASEHVRIYLPMDLQDLSMPPSVDPSDDRCAGPWEFMLFVMHSLS